MIRFVDLVSIKSAPQFVLDCNQWWKDKMDFLKMCS